MPGFPTAPTRVVIARPTPPQARPSHPGGPPVSGALVSKGWGSTSGEILVDCGKDKTEFSFPQQGAGLGTNTSLAQMVSGLVGQLLMQPVLVGESCSFLAHTLGVSSCHWVRQCMLTPQRLGGWDWRITEFKDIDYRLNF